MYESDDAYRSVVLKVSFLSGPNVGYFRNVQEPLPHQLCSNKRLRCFHDPKRTCNRP